jgi:hypothetical protein
MTDKEIIYNFLQTIKKEIIDRHEAAGQRATGNTINSMEVEADDSKGILSGPAHIGVLEDGRGPTKGGAGSGKKLSEVIREWIDAKGINPNGVSKNSLAFLIARKIHNEGTLLFQHGGKSGVVSLSITEDRITAFLNAFAKKYTSQVKSEMLTEFYK